MSDGITGIPVLPLPQANFRENRFPRRPAGEPEAPGDLDVRPGMPDTIPRMGRPPGGADARKIVANTKITRHEEQILVRRFGTRYKGMRAAVDLLMRSTGESAARDVGAAGDTTECRIHKEWQISDPWYDQGQKMVKKTCTACGHETVDRAR